MKYIYLDICSHENNKNVNGTNERVTIDMLRYVGNTVTKRLFT